MQPPDLAILLDVTESISFAKCVLVYGGKERGCQLINEVKTIEILLKSAAVIGFNMGNTE